ncbi:hypothetical protein NUSPORA_02595 [Nucleospora cyclopteri]
MKNNSSRLILFKDLFYTISCNFTADLFFHWTGVFCGVSLLFYVVFYKIKSQEKLTAIASSISPSSEQIADFFKSAVACVVIKHLAIMLCDFCLLGVYKAIRIRELKKMLQTEKGGKTTQELKNHAVITKYRSVVIYDTIVLMPQAMLMICLTLIKAYRKSMSIFCGIVTALLIFYILYLLLSGKQSRLKLKMMGTEDKLNRMIMAQTEHLSVIKSFNLTEKAERNVNSLLEEHSKAVIQYERFKTINIGLPETGDFIVLLVVLLLSQRTRLKYASFFEVSLKAGAVFKELSVLVKEANKTLSCLVGIAAYQVEEKQFTGGNKNNLNSFNYVDMEIINSIVRIHRGEKVALYGNCDFGSDLIRETAGLLQKHRVKINGLETSKINKQFFIKNISYVPRDCQILHGNITDNLLSKNNVTKKTLQDLQNLMQNNPDLLSFTTSLPLVLSKGQLNAINISRGILKNSDLMVIDNSLYSMNPTQKVFFINKIIKLNRAVLFNVNELEDCKYFDRVIFIEGENVREQTNK